MTVYLRKATASQEVPLGQMLSSTDGLTAFTTQIEVTDIHLWKAGATTLAHSSAVATHISNGVFYTVLDATDTDTAGPLVIYTQPTGALPARLECIVLNAAVYDAWFSTGFLPVDLVNVHGAALTETTTQLAAGISKFFDVASPTSTMNLITAVTTCTTNTDMRGTDSAALATELAKVPKSDSNVTWNATALASINAEVDTALNTAIPASNTASSVNDILLDVLTLAAINAEVDTALNTAIPGSPTNDSINQRIVALDDLTQASGAGDLAAILTDTGVIGALGAGLTAIPWNAAWDAEVESECKDALDVYDPPTNAEMEARTIVAADYVVVGDTIARVTLVDKVTLTDKCTLTDTCTVNTDMRGTDSAALATEMAKVPKSDAAVTWNATALASINAEVDTALNTAIPASNTATSVNDILLDVLTLAAINAEVDTALNTAVPGSPTADSINQRVVAIDALTEASGAGDLAAILTDTGTTLDALIKRTLGLNQENFSISSPVFSVTGKMTSCTTTIYPTALDCTNDTNAVASYTTTATYDVDDNLATYKVVKA